jgi:DNA modification methylase
MEKRQMTYQILKGNSLDLLPTLADNSIDAIVTDPPYGLGNPDPDYIIKAIQQWASGDRSHIPEGKGFMGKSWDSFVPPPAIWDECLRVLKPGGHLLAFAGTRTYDLMGISIRMAGFEIRDSIGWVYGSGFPKSLDVSKAIDKDLAKVPNLQNAERAIVAKNLLDLLQKSGKSRSEIDSHFGSTNISQYWFSPDRNPEIVPVDKWPWVREWLNAGQQLDREVWRLNGLKGEPQFDLSFKREDRVVKNGTNSNSLVSKSKQVVNSGQPITPEAQQWQGWGTALKPALEPIVVARKPLIGTVAENVLTHGTGGLNIDASRIDGKPRTTHTDGNHRGNTELYGQVSGGNYEGAQGRWPANLILDEYTAELLDEQSGKVRSNHNKTNDNSGFGDSYVGGSLTRPVSGPMYSDSGGASRFFYVAKASKRDRNEGLEELEDSGQHKWNGSVGHRGVGDYYPDGTPRPVNPMKNFHPTVKPTALMQYLVKLITPPGGTVLDPFTGSGSTGKAAILEGFDFIGIELTEDYWPIIEGRLKHSEAKVAEAKENREAQPQGLF